ncbi:sister chromatid cohesion protein PDS5 homolog A-like isoform X2 [Andrographis paniculata]|uniref:sister chromatid cohesion protein PDS5 homolog A-like isoform X2 n=1 Tax=Andrographis paniculata TaxID=175694 RepID=UPI0021E912AA|nr:sister chromatid cohesion protein PDS5 homolog A-like isoform X2 [Andrographis paniculata]
MAHNLERQLKELGSKLGSAPSSADAVVEILKDCVSCLSKLDQTPSNSMKVAMQPLMNAIAKPALLKHENEEVKLFVASCASELTRITAPEAPYDDGVLQDIFRLIVNALSGLSDIKAPSFQRRVQILETLATYRSCVLMLDLECDDLINEMIYTLFNVVRDEHHENVLTLIQKTIEVLLEESDGVMENFLLVLLSTLGCRKEESTMAARRLATNILSGCASKLEHGIKQFFMSLMSGNNSPQMSEINYHRILDDICCSAPHIFSGVISYLTAELLSEHLDIRLKAVNLVGGLFSLPGPIIHEALLPVLSEFLTRLTDRDMEVRVAVIDYVKDCLLENPFKVEAQPMISGLCDRLMDNDENVRKKVVSVICDVACHDLRYIPVETIKMIAERLQDESLLVKKYTMERLADIHRVSCKNQPNSGTNVGEYDWIIRKLLRCFYDRDFGSDTIEPILFLSLFPDSFSIKDKVKNWIRAFSGFDKFEVRAFVKILQQKQRLQKEMQTYLLIRELSQEGEESEIQEKVKSCFRVMSHCFRHPSKAEDDFWTLDKLKDCNLGKILKQLIDPMISSPQAIDMQDELQNILGQEHQLCEFLRILSIKCSYSMFCKDHVKELLLETRVQKSSGNNEGVLFCMSVLVILAQFCPLLFGIEEDLVHLLEGDNEIIKESTLHILVMAGETIREKLGFSLRSLESILECICIEGSRWQAKRAVHALEAITKENGLMAISALYERLVNMLEEKSHLPSILQSLGCIGEVARSVFETRESEVETFIKEKILKLRYISGKETISWDDRSELCSLKIFGIKALVKSYLKVKDAHFCCGIDGLIIILKSILLFGDISRETNLSLVDKAHLKLAAAKAVLCLSKHWENKVPVDVLYLALQTSEDSLPEVRKFLVKKVHQYIRDCILDPKYACAFLFDISSSPSDLELCNFYLYDIIKMCRERRGCNVFLQNYLSSPSLYPEYILPYMVHSLAHHPSFPSIDGKDVTTFEPMTRKLYLFLSMLVHEYTDRESDVGINKDMGSSVSLLSSIFQRIRFSEDAVDSSKSKNSHALCILGMQILKLLSPDQDNFQDASTPVALPSMLYNPDVMKGENIFLFGKERLWLQGVSDHFESFDLGDNIIVQSTNPDDEVMMDSEREGSDMLHEKLIKRLMAEETRGRQERYEPVQALLSNEQDFEIMKMDEEIEATDLGTTKKLDNYNVYTRRRRGGHELKKSKMLIGESTDAPMPKRRRTSIPRTEKPPLEVSSKGSKGPTSENENEKNIIPDSDKRAETVPTGSDSDKGQGNGKGPAPNETDKAPEHQVHSSQKRTSKRLSSSVKPGKRKTRKYGLAAKKGKKPYDDAPDCPTSSSQSESDGEKPKTVTRLRKQTTKSNGGLREELVGRKIKIWWPLDNRYYEGIVESFKSKHRKHEIRYNDGEVEVLKLDEEKWEFLTKDRKAKDFSLSKGSCLKKESLSSSKKRTPQKSLRQESNIITRSTSLRKGRGKLEISTDPTSEQEHDKSDVEKGENIDQSEELSHVGKASNDSQDGEKHSVTSDSHDADRSDSEDKSSGRKRKSNETNKECAENKSGKHGSKNSALDELPDNETLRMWRRRVKKG